MCHKRSNDSALQITQPLSVAGMNQAGTDAPPTAPTRSMTLTAAKKPATEAAEAWPSAACSGGEDAHSEGSGGAPDSTPGQRGGASHAPAATSVAPAGAGAAISSADVAAAAAAAVAAATVATASCAAATAAATVAAAAVNTGAGKHHKASVTGAASRASETEAAAGPVVGAAAPAAAVRTPSTSSGSSNSEGSSASGATREAGKGDQARRRTPPGSLSAWLKQVYIYISVERSLWWRGVCS